MNKTKHIILAGLALLSLGASLCAEPVKLSRASASELYVSLSSADSGLSPANTVAAADNINALRPQVEALDKGRTAYQKALRGLSKTNGVDLDLKAQLLADDLEAKANEESTFELYPINLTDDEIAAAKLKPAVLAVLRRLLPKKTSTTK